MAIIGNIGGVPIFDKKEEALVWGKRNNLTGYHIHMLANKTGYMGGSEHAGAVQAVTGVTSIATPTPTPTPPSPPVPPIPPVPTPPVPPPPPTPETPTPTPILRVPPPTGGEGY